MEHRSAVLVDFDTGFEKPAKLGPARLAHEIVIDGAGRSTTTRTPLRAASARLSIILLSGGNRGL